MVESEDYIVDHVNIDAPPLEVVDRVDIQAAKQHAPLIELHSQHVYNIGFSLDTIFFLPFLPPSSSILEIQF